MNMTHLSQLSRYMFRFLRMLIIYYIGIILISVTTEGNKDITVTVNCDAIQGMIVKLVPVKPFTGRIYTRDYMDIPPCSNQFRDSMQMDIAISFTGCGTKKRYENTYSNVVIVQKNQFLITADDSAYEIICEPFSDTNETFSTQEVTAEIGPLLEPSAIFTATTIPPIIFMNIYDFRKDTYVRNVKMGQIYELEIDLQSAVYGGFVKNCVAKSEINNQNFTLLDDQGCPRDVRIFDKAYIDDQSKTTGHYYIYMPFEVFLFANGGNKVTFQCDVVICRDRCQPVDCGSVIKQSYGKRRRRKREQGAFPIQDASLHSMTTKEHSFLGLPVAAANSKDTNFESTRYTDGQTLDYLPITKGFNNFTAPPEMYSTHASMSGEGDEGESNLGITEKPVSKTFNVISDAQILERTLNDMAASTTFLDEFPELHTIISHEDELKGKTERKAGASREQSNTPKDKSVIDQGGGFLTKLFPSLAQGPKFLSKLIIILWVLGVALIVSVSANILLTYKLKADKTQSQRKQKYFDEGNLVRQQHHRNSHHKANFSGGVEGGGGECKVPKIFKESKRKQTMDCDDASDGRVNPLFFRATKPQVDIAVLKTNRKHLNDVL